MPNPVVAVLAAGNTIQARNQKKANKRALAAQIAASDASIGEQRAAREAFEQRTQPFVDFGQSVMDQISDLVSSPIQVDPEQANPLVNFLRQEGFEDIQESAAAQGRLGAGGTLEELTRFNTNLTSTIAPQLQQQAQQAQQQRFSQLFNILGLGANAATGQGTAGLQTASSISNLLGAQGAARAAGAQRSADITSGFINQGASLLGAQQAGLFNPAAASSNQGLPPPTLAGALGASGGGVGGILPSPAGSPFGGL